MKPILERGTEILLGAILCFSGYFAYMNIFA